MTDPRTPEGPPEEFEHDEYHSSLEVDDSTGWRVFVIPGILIVLVIGMIALFFIYQGDVEPDPRVQAQMERKAQERAARDAERAQQPVQPAPVPAIQPDAMTPTEGEAAPAGTEAEQPVG